MSDEILNFSNVSLSFGGIKVLKNISFTVKKGEIFSIIGPNGAGKTSAINCISGRYKPNSGDVYYQGKSLAKLKIHQRADIGIGRTFQNLALFSHMTVLENIMVGRHRLIKPNFLSSLFFMGNARQSEIISRRKVEEIIDFVEIQHVRNVPAGTLSYGVLKRVELARAIAVEPKLLLLDEPMAGMNLEEKEDMARFITELNSEFDITVVMIEHDIRVVTDISDEIVVLDFGEKIAEGDSETVVNHPRVKAAYLGEQ